MLTQFKRANKLCNQESATLGERLARAISEKNNLETRLLYMEDEVSRKGRHIAELEQLLDSRPCKCDGALHFDTLASPATVQPFRIPQWPEQLHVPIPSADKCIQVAPVSRDAATTAEDDTDELPQSMAGGGAAEGSDSPGKPLDPLCHICRDPSGSQVALCKPCARRVKGPTDWEQSTSVTPAGPTVSTSPTLPFSSPPLPVFESPHPTRFPSYLRFGGREHSAETPHSTVSAEPVSLADELKLLDDHDNLVRGEAAQRREIERSEAEERMKLSRGESANHSLLVHVISSTAQRCDDLQAEEEERRALIHEAETQGRDLLAAHMKVKPACKARAATGVPAHVRVSQNLRRRAMEEQAKQAKQARSLQHLVKQSQRELQILHAKEESERHRIVQLCERERSHRCGEGRPRSRSLTGRGSTGSAPTRSSSLSRVPSAYTSTIRTTLRPRLLRGSSTPRCESVEPCEDTDSPVPSKHVSRALSLGREGSTEPATTPAVPTSQPRASLSPIQVNCVRNVVTQRTKLQSREPSQSTSPAPQTTALDTTRRAARRSYSQSSYSTRSDRGLEGVSERDSKEWTQLREIVLRACPMLGMRIGQINETRDKERILKQAHQRVKTTVINVMPDRRTRPGSEWKLTPEEVMKIPPHCRGSLQMALQDIVCSFDMLRPMIRESLQTVQEVLLNTKSLILIAQWALEQGALNQSIGAATPPYTPITRFRSRSLSPATSIGRFSSVPTSVS
eukprot:Sspe_Gene.5036::Locus_1655_Transcript_1_1_Confidence_1.000_Length_2662::g.5036::m.5036